MLKIPAPYPQVGSYALFVDDTLAVEQQRAELVRIQSHEVGSLGALISFPLRIGSTGSKRVMLEQLIDATALTKAEEVEMHDIARHLSGRERLTKKQRELKARGDALRHRHIMSGVMEIEQRKLDRLQARSQHSIGGHIPNEIAA